MPNPITGDFEAVLQISGSTINRLLATMHQNSWSNTKLPSFPHSASLRVGSATSKVGVRGNAKVQMGVPRVELIHNVSDRFRLSLGVRAWFTPDSGSDYMPEYINGTVTAEYRLVDIDPNCVGWKKIAADYLWVRVVRDSVKFEGSAVDGGNAISVVVVDPDEAKRTVTQQVALLLATQFEAAPHPVSKRFRKGMLRSLNAPVTGSAVTFPVGVTGEPAGAISSIKNVVLGGEDLALGIAAPTILGLAQPLVDFINQYRPTVAVHVGTPWPAPDIDTVYRVQVGVTGVQWLPQGSFAIIRVTAHGSARTDSVLADATFDVTQDVTLGFDAGSEGLVLSPGARTVKTNSSGLGSGEVANAVNGAVDKAVASLVGSLCAQATGNLGSISARKSELEGQLQTLDDKASASFESAEFVIDGVVMRGRIRTSGRKAGVVKFDKTIEEDGFSALFSWIPGGRIDRFSWTWGWYNGGTSGSASHTDRFVLRRPRSYKYGKWGAMVGIEETEKLPGLDGMGSVCLTIKGARVDSVSGEFVPYTSTVRCSKYGFPLHVIGTGTHVWPIYYIEPDLPTGPRPVEAGLIDVTLPLTSEANAANTLLLYAARGKWEKDFETTLAQALHICGRNDAALQVVAIFPHGALDLELAGRIQSLTSSLGAPVFATEDVNGAWARSYSVPEDSALSWRLLRPAGGVSWMHDGELNGERLSSVLDACLIPGTPSRFASIDAPLRPGLELTASAFHLGIGDLETVESRCPPLPAGRLGSKLVVAFVQAWSSSSLSELRHLAGRQSEDDEETIYLAVGDGLDREQAEKLQNELGLEMTILPDPEGVIRRRFGVRQWPTTVQVDAEGLVTDLSFERRSGTQARKLRQEEEAT